MNKYTAVFEDIYSIFGAVGWLAENIKTFPDNYVGASVGNEYLRVSIVPSGNLSVNPPLSVSGQLIIDIFIPAGSGLKRLTTIADRLDTYLAGKTVTTSLSGSTQLKTSALSLLGNDRDNPSLYRGSYSISFNYFGK